MYSVKPIPSFESTIDSIDKSHKIRISKMIDKLQENGLNSLNILSAYAGFILGEIKSKKPPYRLYIIYDQSKKTFYLCRWAHKKEQEKIINELKLKMNLGIDKGLEYIFGID